MLVIIVDRSIETMTSGRVSIRFFSRSSTFSFLSLNTSAGTSLISFSDKPRYS